VYIPLSTDELPSVIHLAMLKCSVQNPRAVCNWEGNGITKFDVTLLGIRNTGKGKCLKALWWCTNRF
jgi:hypothetical protein